MNGRLPPAGLVALGIACGSVVAAGYLTCLPIGEPRLRASVIRSIEAASGLSIKTAGPMTLDLLPQPSLVIANVALMGDGGAVMVDDDALRVKIRWADLLRGHFQAESAELDGATITLDVDRLLPQLKTVMGGRTGSEDAPPAARRFLHSNGLSLRGGVVRLMSRHPLRDCLFTEVSATMAWPRATDEASLSGQATWRGAAFDVSLSLDTPQELNAGRATAAMMSVKSAILDLTAAGTLRANGPILAQGRLAAATPDLAAFLHVMGTPLPQLAAVHSARLGGNAIVSADGLALAQAQLGLDDMSFEGALAFHDHGGRPGIVGTLATEHMNLDPFFAALPAPETDNRSWSSVAFNTRLVADDDIDLRISASQAKVGPVDIEDGSLSVQSGNGRMELSLGEARAFDGLLKGRIVATLLDGQTDLRAEATVSRLDLAGLADAVVGSGRLHGLATGHITLDGHGSSPDDLVGSLSGEGLVSIRDGEVAAALFGAIVKPGPFARWPSSLPTAFDLASMAFTIDRGRVLLGDSEIMWPSLRAWVTGSVSIPQQTADLRAVVSPVGNGAGSPAAAPTAVRLAGSWRDLRFKPERIGF